MIHQPIILIHGFNGSPSNWTGPADRFPDFLAARGYDPSLIRVFNYGEDKSGGKATYNSLGDIREIAHRLDGSDLSGPDLENCSVDNLSKESVAAGGPPKVTIIAHSSGGLVARYYLACSVPDSFGTRYRGNVDRVIFLGTPHQGVDVEDILDPLPTNLLVYRLMVRLHYLFPPEYREQAESLRKELGDLHRETKQLLAGEQAAREDTGETPAFKELHPHSPLLEQINRPGAMPRDIEYFNIVGDIRVRVQIEVGGRHVFDHTKSLGDLLVTTASAGSIPNAPSQCFQLVQERCLALDLSRNLSREVSLSESGVQPLPVHRWLRSLPAARERMLEILNRKRG
ncbi:MAG: esterase/lipase family protein [Rudaea sp.]